MKEKPQKKLLHQCIAKDIMTRDVEVVKETMRIGQLTHLMLDSRVSSFPVVNNNKRLIGLVTINDLFSLVDKIAWNCARISKKRKRINIQQGIDKYKNQPVKDIMSTNVFSITPDTPLIEIIEAVVKWRIHTFPVMKGNKLVGIIGRHDVLNATFGF